MLNSSENTEGIQDNTRLELLQDFEVLDTHPDFELELITNLLGEIFNAPIALITFSTDKQLFVKSSTIELTNRNLTNDSSLFELFLKKNTAVIIEDIQIERTLSGRKFYFNDEEIRFFATAPLKSLNGQTIGNICVIDFEPKQTEQKNLITLKKFANLVMEKLQQRLLLRNTLRANDDRLHMLIHDLKNPMTTLLLNAELVGKIASDEEKVFFMSGKIINQAKNIVGSINDILNVSKTEQGVIKILKSKLDLHAVLEQVKANFLELSTLNQQEIIININEPLEIFGDEKRLILAFEQIVNNAIKFSSSGNIITIEAELQDNQIVIAVKDNGQGILKDELGKIFVKFISLSAIPQIKKGSVGLGLSLAKMLIDLHKGKIWAESNGRNEGSTFFVSLPIK